MADEPQSPVDRWLGVTKAYDNEFKKWTARATKIIKRYRDDTTTSTGNETARFNILWSNVQTLVPAVYASVPKADVSRRFTDNDPVARVAALLIERALDYELEHYPDYRATMKNAVEDRFLGGRGVGWVRYEPHVVKQSIPEDGLQVTEDEESEDETDNAPEKIDYECAPTDYVHWKDFGHSVARTWEEVSSVWRWVYMTRDAAEERFGDVARKMAFDTAPEQLTKQGMASRINDRAKVCELWDKDTKTVFWFQDGVPDMLDTRPDPLDLEGFFPCDKPLYATTTSDTLVPVPDFTLYQDQAKELDLLADRIDGLVQALRVRGVYDSSQPALQRLLTEGENNTLIPVDKWMAMSEKGGLKGSIDILPIDMIAACLLQAYQAMDQIKSQIYEITGISDIIRGEGAASETATAQQIKGQYAGLRLRSMQEAVALFASGMLRLKAQIICTKYQPQTILSYAGASQMSPEDQQMIPQALELIKDNPLRNFRIQVDADSLVQLDENQNKQDRVEFLNAFSNFLREAVPAGQATPELAPMLMEMIKFGIAGFKQARSIEGTIDTALQQLTAKAQQNAANPQPSPEVQQMQAQHASDQAKMQTDAEIAKGKAAAELQIEQLKAQHQRELESEKLAGQHAIKQMEIQSRDELDRWKADLDAATKIMVARISANPGADPLTLDATNSAQEEISKTLGGTFSDIADKMLQSHQQMADTHIQAMNGFTDALSKLNAPKRIVRGQDGRAVGVEPVPQAPQTVQ